MLVGAPRGARCSAKHLIVRSNPDTPPGAIRALRLVGAPTPSIGGHGRREMRANPWPEAETGADTVLIQTIGRCHPGRAVSASTRVFDALWREPGSSKHRHRGLTHCANRTPREYWVPAFGKTKPNRVVMAAATHHPPPLPCPPVGTYSCANYQSRGREGCDMNRAILAASVVVAGGFLAAAFVASSAFAQSLGIEVLSSRPELVSGGDALVRITAGAAPAVSVGGTDVSTAFKSDNQGGWVGLVTGLKDGPNQLAVKADGKDASLTLTNHPVNATLFAGPQQSPFVCENESHGLASAKDASCAAPATVKYFYRDRAGVWKPFNASAARPNDISTTKTSEGREVPLIVRQEKGVINRSAYVINILHDPAAGPLPTPTAPSSASGWNGRLIYSFGGGVQANYHMGRTLG